MARPAGRQQRGDRCIPPNMLHGMEAARSLRSSAREGSSTPAARQLAPGLTGWQQTLRSSIARLRMLGRFLEEAPASSCMAQGRARQGVGTRAALGVDADAPRWEQPAVLATVGRACSTQAEERPGEQQVPDLPAEAPLPRACCLRRRGQTRPFQPRPLCQSRSRKWRGSRRAAPASAPPR